MKNTKRILVVAILCVMVLFSFTACHSHKAKDDWNIDKDYHWRECECGEVLETQAHVFDEDICTVCEAQLTTEDGVVSDIVLWNEYGDWIICIYYDETGAVESDMRAEYTYDDDGNKLSEKTYVDGILFTEGEYGIDSEGYSYLKAESEIYEDGSKCVYEYNEYGDNIGYKTYDTEGNFVASCFSEYETDDDGNVIAEKVYENDVLSQEIKYINVITDEEEYAYTSQVTYYYEDGKFVEEYNEEGDIIREISYDSEDNLVYDYTCENVYNDEGLIDRVEKYENGVLARKAVYEYDEEGNQTAEKLYEGETLLEEILYTESDGYVYESKKIVYNDDGTTEVYEYDENGNIIS